VAEILYPGVYIEETASSAHSIAGVETSTPALIGKTKRGPYGPKQVLDYSQYAALYGDRGSSFDHSVRLFFENGGTRALIQRLRPSEGLVGALARLEASEVSPFALVAVPGVTTASEQGLLVAFCESTARFAVLDAPSDDPMLESGLGLTSYAARYAPWLNIIDDGGNRRLIPPSGAVLGIYQRTDIQRGIWKAPANEALSGIAGVERPFGEPEQNLANERRINLIRAFPERGIRVWGARTMTTDNEWKYMPVRRLALYIENSVRNGIQWAAFEPNGEVLWKQVVASVWTFMAALWKLGAFQGDKPEHAFYVRGDHSTTTQADFDLGRFTLEIGFAPIRSGEFLVLRIAQQAI
jgi:phage tail sheath protein FI